MQPTTEIYTPQWTPQLTAKILIVEDEEALRFYTTYGLSRIGWQTQAVESGEAALELLEKETFDVVLLDLHLGEIDGITVMRYIKMRWPETIVIIITAFATVNSAIEGIRQGAFDYLRKPVTADEIASCIKKALAQKESENQKQKNNASPAGPTDGFEALLPESFQIPQSIIIPDTGETLTSREIQVLVLLSTGATNRTIAEQLVITPKTVKNHINSIRRKLNICSRAEAVTSAHKLGLIPDYNN